MAKTLDIGLLGCCDLRGGGCLYWVKLVDSQLFSCLYRERRDNFSMNASSEVLIRLLADGQFHSGEKIGACLGISRAGVWKKLQSLAAYGIHVESVKGKGYQLSKPIELLDKQSILSAVGEPTQALISQMELLWEVDSTNRHLLQGSAQGADSGRVCLAEFQTSGRGRRGRQWYSPPGNISLSFSWVFEQGAAALGGLSLSVGVGVAQALASLGIDQVRLKWPNDLLVDKAKLGGILIEMSGDPSGLCRVVVGVGLNVSSPPLAENVDQATAALCQLKENCSRQAVVAALLKQLLPMVASYAESGFAPYKNAWMQLDAFRGQQVAVISGDQSRYGVAQGVNDAGALILETDGVMTEVHGGELSLRLLS